MENKKLGCITRGGIIGLGVAVIATGITYLISNNQMFSPGELTSLSKGNPIKNVSSHADLSGDCKSCHSAPWDEVDMEDLCLDCHSNIQVQLNDIHTFHGAAISILYSRDCRLCHTDHIGADENITKYDGEGFPHDLVGFSLDSHQNQTVMAEHICSDCHISGYLDIDHQICEDCHLEIALSYTKEHITIFSSDCLSCHDGVETINSEFDHNKNMFSLSGEHERILCQDCHANASNLEAFQSAPNNCSDCHVEDDVHQGFLGKSCIDCHTPAGWIPGSYDHTLTGFLINGGHSYIPCADCHPSPTFQGLSPECYTCHSDDEPHQGGFGMDCTICHSVPSWDLIHFDHSEPFVEECTYCHQKNSPGDHYQGQCSACHIITGWLPATFNHYIAGATDCLSCHLPDQPVNHYAGQCSMCHSTSRWKPSSINHTFPVSHGGASNRCNLCHPGNNFYTYSCYQCHEHGKSEVQKEHENISNLANCLRCHWDGRKHESGEDDD